jgi:TPP-dependent pyruvate/acetoin dehydrogenase alpha subunit
VTCCFFGDGAVAEGEFHESLNLAALWQLPVLFVCENNLYAIGTALKLAQSVTDVAQKAASYAIPALPVDGMDVIAVETAAQSAAAAVRAGERPYFLECRTYRFRAHSMFDAELYRSRAEVEEWRQRDPITNFVQRLKQRDILNDDDIEGIERDVAREIEAAVAFAEVGTWEPVEDLTRFVYSERRAG